jgi:hypothetical protein
MLQQKIGKVILPTVHRRPCFLGRSYSTSYRTECWGRMWPQCGRISEAWGVWPIITLWSVSIVNAVLHLLVNNSCSAWYTKVVITRAARVVDCPCEVPGVGSRDCASASATDL